MNLLLVSLAQDIGFILNWRTLMGNVSGVSNGATPGALVGHLLRRVVNNGHQRTHAAHFIS